MKFKLKKLSIKVTYIIIGLIIGVVIPGCSFNVNATQPVATQPVNLTSETPEKEFTSDFSFYSANCDFNMNESEHSFLNSKNTFVYILIDNETNNEYIVLMRSGKVTITPRYYSSTGGIYKYECD